VHAILVVVGAHAHEVRPAYLDIRQTAPDTYDVMWKVPALGELRLGIYVEMPAGSTRDGEVLSFMTGDAYVERWTVTCPDGLSDKTIRIAGLESTRIDVLARVQHANGAVQTARILPSHPTFVVDASPSFVSIARTYAILGVEHILLGIDHLLFVLALVLLVKGWRRLVETITMFTIAHSITLALASLGAVSVPGAPVEACIALSIVFVAAEIIRARQGRPGLTERFPWIVAFTFGLLHGLGFAGALHEIGLPAQAIPAALLFFNVGVEIGQLAFIGVVLGVLAIALRIPVKRPAWTWRLAPYAIGTIAMVWVVDRINGFI
jgi:hydrogenase/urease accessory protein HupE